MRKKQMGDSKILHLLFSVFFALIGSIALSASQAKADDASDAGSSVARISVLHGNVAMQRSDSGDTVAASINAPVNVGDYLSTTAGDSRAEVQLDANDFVRVSANSQLRFTQLDPSKETVQMAAGTIELRMFKYAGDPQVDTPSISIRPNVAGQYRVSVAGDGSTTFTVRSGSADLLAPQGTRTIGAGLTVVISGTSSNPVIRPTAVVAYDSFDSWNAQRDQYAQQAYSDQYVNANMVGADDLNADGHWVWVADYGNVWVPYGVGPGWAPYHDGRWVWEPYYGWTWVGYEPWGWAPYHYGRWLYTGGYGWAWYPGPVYVRPVYRPALVAFFGFGSGGSRFSFAFGNVGWVPLAPYEPFRPWWGPTIVNRTVINITNVNVTNVNVTHIYRNAQVTGGVAVVSHANFTDGTSYHYVAVHPGDLRSVSLIKNTVPIVPTRQNLSFTKVEPGHTVVAPPLSTHFARLSAPTKLPPSFDSQQKAIEASNARVYHSNGTPTRLPAGNGIQTKSTGSATSQGTGPSTAWGRFNANRGAAARVDAPAGAGSGAPANPNSKDPWSKFAPANNAYTANPGSAAHHSGNTTSRHASVKQKKPSGSKKPAAGNP